MCPSEATGRVVKVTNHTFDSNPHLNSAFGYPILWFLIRPAKSIGDMAKPSPLHSGHPALVGLGLAIRKLRSEQGLSQEGLAHEIGLDRSYIGGIERGEHNLTLMNLLKIAEKLGIDPSELLKQASL